MSGINRLDLKQLRVLQALLQERNLSRVASKMGLTQQAISEQLRKLREVFDDRLFIRCSSGVVPTPLAESLGEKVNRILEDVEGLLAPEQFDPAKLKGIFVISATDYAVKVVLPPLLARVRTLAPELKLIICDFESDNLNQLMVSGELDLALTFPAFVPDSYPSLLLFQEHHVLVAGRNSPLAGKPLTLAEVAPMPQLVISPSRPNLRGSADDWFAAQGLKRNIVMSAPSFSAAPDIIEAAGTIAFLPSRLLPNDRVIPLDLKATPPCFDIIAAWHNRSTHSPIHRWILDLLKEIFVQ